MTTTLYFGGIPTGPDVKRLLERFGSPAPGLIPYEEIERAIDERRGHSRFRTVVIAWRHRLLRESNIATRAEAGEGIRILTEPERVDEGKRMIGLSARRVLAQHRWNLMIDVTKLDELARRKHDHLVRYSLALATSAQTGMKQLNAALKVPEQLPRGKQA
jgi:hypothetical protein